MTATRKSSEQDEVSQWMAACEEPHLHTALTVLQLASACELHPCLLLPHTGSIRHPSTILPPLVPNCFINIFVCYELTFSKAEFTQIRTVPFLALPGGGERETGLGEVFGFFLLFDSDTLN